MSYELLKRIEESPSGVYHVNSIFYQRGEKIAEFELSYCQLGKLESFDLPSDHPAYRHGKPGKGVRAKDKILANSIVGFYAGIYRLGIFGPENPYVFGVHPVKLDMVIDAQKVGNITRYINDPRETGLSSNLVAEDAIFQQGAHTIRGVQFKATRTISVGEELLLEYEASMEGYWNAYRRRFEILDLTITPDTATIVKVDDDPCKEYNSNNQEPKTPWAGSKKGDELVELVEGQFQFLLEKFRTYAMNPGHPNKLLESWLHECQERINEPDSDSSEQIIPRSRKRNRQAPSNSKNTSTNKNIPRKEAVINPEKKKAKKPITVSKVRRDSSRLRVAKSQQRDLQALQAVNALVKQNFIKTSEAFRRFEEHAGTGKFEQIIVSWKTDSVEENDSLSKLFDGILHAGPHLLRVARYSRLRQIFLKYKPSKVKQVRERAPFQVAEREFSYLRSLYTYAGGGFILGQEYRVNGKIWNSDDIRAYFSEFDARIREKMDGNLISELDLIAAEQQDKLTTIESNINEMDS
jgi:hypothetical protein